MNTACTEHGNTGMSPDCSQLENQEQDQRGSLMYQAATVLAILLFFISF